MVEIDDDGFARVAKLFKTGGRPRLEPVVIKLDVPDCPDCFIHPIGPIALFTLARSARLLLEYTPLYSPCPIDPIALLT